MLGLGFDSCSQLQQRQCGCIRVAAEVHDATINDHISDSRLTLGECPGLVEGHHLYRGRALEMDAAFKQDPRRAAPPIADRMEAGVLIISAHGDATTITVMAR